MNKYAIQHKSGQLVDTCESLEDAKKFLQFGDFDIIDIKNSSKLSVWYAEMGGPWGYGHKEPAFITYGPLRKVITNFYKWVQDTAKVFGPDWRDVKDYFRYCSLTINGQDKTDWLIKQVEGLHKGQIFV